jgi:hypothetical protein
MKWLHKRETGVVLLMFPPQLPGMGLGNMARDRACGRSAADDVQVGSRRVCYSSLAMAGDIHEC